MLLVDEINRAMPKTQSALLEAMAEQQVTIDGVTRALPEPFLVLATENPIEQEGTFPLPEAQLDRFFLRTALGYPGEDDELRHRRGAAAASTRSRAAAGASRSTTCTRSARRSRPSTSTRCSAAGSIQLVRATREADGVAIGASVRGSLALERAARAWALLDGRDYVTPVDVERLFLPVVMHRIVFTPSFVATAREIGWEARCRALPRAVPRARAAARAPSSSPMTSRPSRSRE